MVNTVPTVPGAVVALLITGAMPAAAIVVVTVTGLLVPVAFVAVSTTLVTPAAVGVPVEVAVRLTLVPLVRGAAQGGGWLLVLKLP